MLQPKKTKYRKAFKGRISGAAKGWFNLDFGAFGLKAMEPDRLTARQIEAARRAITRHMKRAGRVWIRVFPDVPVSKKPAEVRMGSGKGAPEYWVVRVKPGRIMFEVDGVPRELAARAFELARAARQHHTPAGHLAEAGGFQLAAHVGTDKLAVLANEPHGRDGLVFHPGRGSQTHF